MGGVGRLDDGMHPASPFGILQPDDDDVGDRRVLAQRGLDLGREDIDAHRSRSCRRAGRRHRGSRPRRATPCRRPSRSRRPSSASAPRSHPCTSPPVRTAAACRSHRPLPRGAPFPRRRRSGCPCPCSRDRRSRGAPATRRPGSTRTRGAPRRRRSRRSARGRPARTIAARARPAAGRRPAGPSPATTGPSGRCRAPAPDAAASGSPRRTRSRWCRSIRLEHPSRVEALEQDDLHARHEVPRRREAVRVVAAAPGLSTRCGCGSGPYDSTAAAVDAPST